MIGVFSQKANGYAGASYPNEGSLLMYRKDLPPGKGPGIICNHGRGGNCLQYMPNAARAFGPGWGAWLLALAGYRVMALDNLGATTWGDQGAIDRINDAITYLQDPALGGAHSGKVGTIGWSMGGIATLNWIDQNPSKHACSLLWTPASDMRFFHDVGFNPPYPTNGDPVAAYTAEIDVAHPSGYAGNNPFATPSNYKGVGAIKIVHAADDTVIPQGMSKAFVDAVNDPKVTLKAVNTGGHNGLFGQISDDEIVNFFKDNLPL